MSLTTFSWEEVFNQRFRKGHGHILQPILIRTRVTTLVNDLLRTISVKLGFRVVQWFLRRLKCKMLTYDGHQVKAMIPAM